MTNTINLDDMELEHLSIDISDSDSVIMGLLQICKMMKIQPSEALTIATKFLSLVMIVAAKGETETDRRHSVSKLVEITNSFLVEMTTNMINVAEPLMTILTQKPHQAKNILKAMMEVKENGIVLN